MDENVRRTMTNDGLKFCKGCDEWRSKGDFNKDSSSNDGLSYRCRSCRKKHRREKEVKERTALYNKRYARENPNL